MKFFRQLIFLLCLPGIFLSTPVHADVYQNSAPVEDYGNFSPWDLLNYETLSFSRIINFIYAIEYSQSLDGLLSEEQMRQVRDFVVFLARNGIRDDDIEGRQRLEEDITKLLSDDDDDDEEDPPPWWYFSGFNGYQGFKIKPAIFGNEKPQIRSCGWLSETFKKTKNFIKKHKKAVIISAAVVVTATVIIVATGGGRQLPWLGLWGQLQQEEWIIPGLASTSPGTLHLRKIIVMPLLKKQSDQTYLNSRIALKWRKLLS